ncbi:MAG TPA: hypothetical protein VKU01_32005 [Bryobacteraceae bacterium]|nr:hypothetical protein [Bryobacteraceae bacterium]
MRSIVVSLIFGAVAVSQTPATKLQTAGMVGLAPGQTARLNVLNPGLPAPAGTAVICSGTLSIQDDKQNELKNTSVSVLPGQSSAVDLNADTDLKISTRIQIRGVVSSFRTCLVPTLEIFDNATGKTTVIVTQTNVTPPSTGTTLTAVTPCRVADTRADQGKADPFGPPTIKGNTSRSFPIPAGSCSIPSDAQAYALNITVVPHGQVGFLTAWPDGQTQPVAATLTWANGTFITNSAIVAAGNNGAIDVYVSDDADVVIDISGYFEPASI